MVTWGSSGTEAEDKTLQLGTFFPELSIQDFCLVYRIPSSYNIDTIKEYLSTAMIFVHKALDVFKAEAVAAGYETLASMEADTIDGVSEKVVLYERACFCAAKAELLRETATIDQRAVAANSAKSGAETEEKYREFASDAISALAGYDLIDIQEI